MSAIQQISVTLHRTWEGMRVSVKLHPRIEEFFRSKAEGNRVDVAMVGRYWKSPSKLEVYDLPPELGGNQSIARPDHYTLYRLDRVGDRLLMGNEVANMSFLRLVGASEDDGVSFMVPGVFSEDALVELNRGIEKASESFFRSFIKTVKLTSVISIVEQEGGSGSFQEVRQSS